MTLDMNRRRDRRRGSRARVWLNGVEVKNCFYVDERRGVVRLYRLNAEGKKYIERPESCVATEERRGCVKVRIRPLEQGA